MMHTHNWTKLLLNRWLPFLVLLIAFPLVAACGGGASEEVAFEDVPARRGNVELAGEVKDLVAEILGIPFADVSEEMDLRDDLGATDAQMGELADLFAEVYEIELTDAEIDGVTTVQSAIDLIASKLE